VRLIDGLISDCGKFISENKAKEGWFEVSTLKEPYRIEGKKTMGYELWEEFGGRLPDVIIYPTGGGVGLIGMWKAFDELEVMGKIGRERPRMVAAQAAGCAPIVKAFEQHSERSDFWNNAATVASGLRVPKPLGDFLILNDLYASHGEAVPATDDEMLAACRDLSALEGIFAAPEGGAGLVAVQKLVEQEKIKHDETVVLFNTGSGYKYIEAWRAALGM
jgi:threonine synthase